MGGGIFRVLQVSGTNLWWGVGSHRHFQVGSPFIGKHIEHLLGLFTHLLKTYYRSHLIVHDGT